MIQLSCKIDNIYFYSDSTVTLAYINNTEKRFTKYVSRRIEIILNLSSSSQWKYIPSDKNPADLTTRPRSARSLLSSSWLSGPDFLQYSCEKDTNFQACMSISPVALPETETKDEHVVLETRRECLSNMELLMTRNSDWNRVIRVAKFVVKFAKIIADLYFKKRGIVKSFKSDREVSFQLLIKSAQTAFFLGKNKILYSKSVAGLSPFIDKDSIVRVGGRLDKSNFPLNEKHPILLPSNHPICEDQSKERNFFLHKILHYLSKTQRTL